MSVPFYGHEFVSRSKHSLGLTDGLHSAGLVLYQERKGPVGLLKVSLLVRDHATSLLKLSRIQIYSWNQKIHICTHALRYMKDTG